jgi:uncharacterized protein
VRGYRVSRSELPPSRELQLLHEQIEQRSQSIADRQPDWPCHKGCDFCCRRLAELPSLTGAEWQLVGEGLAGLPRATRRMIARRIHVLRAGASAPFTCPFLAPESRSCLIYEYRPVACRTYGFYIERDKGLFCEVVEGRVSRGELTDVIWGNHAAISARLDALGSRTGLLGWAEEFTADGLPDSCAVTE